MNKHGQSIIEYAMIAILVILGTVVMGPYVLRSVNAHFKLWNDSTKDSFEENTIQAPVSVIPHIDTNCTCTSTPKDCGSSSNINQGSCGPGQRIIEHDCSIQGCDGAPLSTCKDDDSCCTTFSPGTCGTTPIGQTPSAGNCNYGQRILASQCPNVPVECQADSSCGLPTCGPVSTINGVPQATACPGSTDDLDKAYSPTYVATQGACTQTKCQYYCNSGILDALGNCMPVYSICCNQNANITSQMHVVFADGSSKAFPIGTFVEPQNSSGAPPVSAYGTAPNCNNGNVTNTAIYNVSSSEWVIRYDDCGANGHNADHDFNDIQCDLVWGASTASCSNINSTGQCIWVSGSNASAPSVCCASPWSAIGGGNGCGSGPSCTGCGGCFYSGTKVLLANGKKVPIEGLKVGDVLLGPDGAHNTIVKFDIMPRRDWKIYSFNGGRYFVTENHVFKTATGWKAMNPALAMQDHPQIKVEQLKIGDMLITINGPVRLEKIKSKIIKDSVVYNPELDGNHEYYADGYLVHNMLKPPQPACCTQVGLTS